MKNKEDIRWIQRFSNYNKALGKLNEAIQKVRKDFYRDNKFDENIFKKADDIIVEGLIQRFEYTHELAWNVIKDFLESRGDTGIYGSRDATREAFNKELIWNGDVWMDMIKSRNQSSHTYNEETAMEIFFKIIDDYQSCFISFQQNIESIKAKEQ